MEDIEELICMYIERSSEASAILSRKKGCVVTTDDIQEALMEVSSTDEPTDLVFAKFSTERMVQMLKGFNFDKLHPVILGRVTLENALLPKGVLSSLIEARIKYEGQLWEFHKNDADPFPSNPHAHLVGDIVKLDLSTGDLYRKKNRVGKMARKDLMDLRSLAQARMIELPTM